MEGLYKTVKNMTVLIGIPAAGKTTVTKNLFSSHVVVSFDRLENRTRNDEDKMILKTCRLGNDIVIDAANIDKAKRRKYIRYAKEHGYKVNAVFVDTSLDAALARNKTRERQVPEGMIRAYCEKVQYPSLDEGFENIFILWNDWDPRDSK